MLFCPPASLKRIVSALCLFALIAGFSQSAAWVHFGTNGTLVYTNDDLGNHLIDYSYAGYMGGGVALPANSIVKTNLTAIAGDNTAAIQNAINYVGGLAAGSNGIRGVVLLNAGTYQMAGTLDIGQSGVILRGSGTNTTVLSFTSANNSGTAITIAGSSGAQQVSGSSTFNITDPYVPLGATSFHLSDTTGLAVGTNIVVVRPWTTSWINAIGVSNLWSASGHASDAERTIVAISSNQVTVNIPLPTPIEQEWCTGIVYACTDSGRVQQSAVENLRMVSVWGLGTTGNTNGFGWIGTHFGNAKNCWVRDVAFDGFGTGADAATSTQTKWCTVQDCSFSDGVNNGSARPPAFEIDGQMCLFQRLNCVSGFQHHCQTADEATGPNVYLYCYATGSDFDGGPHRYWATSLLTDNEYGTVGNVHIVIITGGDNGWGAGYSVFYNCHTANHTIQCPAVDHHYNWWIGGSGVNNNPATDPGTYDQDGTTVRPTSLYLEQLKERLGGAAVENIGYTLFTVSNSPASLSVAGGSIAACTVVIGDPTLMNNTVALNVNGLPPNVGASFTTNSVTGAGNATLTIAASNSVVPGTYILNVVGTSAGLSHTSAVTLVFGTFSLSASPASQSILAGGATSYSVSLATNVGFAGVVNLGLGGLPPAGAGSFAPASLGGNATSALNVSTSTNTPAGNYLLAIFGTNGPVVITATASLIVTNITAGPGTLLWTNGAADINWSSQLNWTNVTGGGYGPPGAANDVVFTNYSTASLSGAIDNIVNNTVTVDSLTYDHSSGFHTTQIAAGNVLSVAGAPGLNVGTGQDNGAGQLVSAAITGAGGMLAVSNTSASFTVLQGSATSGSHRATLDLSGLDTLAVTAARLLIGVDVSLSTNQNRPAGTLLLAKTNAITVSGSSPAIDLADGPSNSGSGVMNLGMVNSVFADTITIGRQKSAATLNFNPAFTNLAPTLYLRGATAGRVTTLAIGDNAGQSGSSSSCSGVLDLSGGVVDAMADTLFVGRGQTGNGTGTANGTLTLAGGTFNVNTLEAGYQNSTNAAALVSGTVNVYGGTLLANSILRLARYTGTGTVPVGTLNLNGGSLQTTNLIGGGGTSAVNLNSGVLNLAGGLLNGISTLNIGAPGVDVDALLEDAAAIVVSNPITIAANGTLAGDTFITAPGMIIDGAISPGVNGGIGAITNSGGVTLGAGGNFIVAVEDAAAGPVAGWSFLQNGGQMAVQSAATNPFTINPQSFNTNNSGLAANFAYNTNYDWLVASAAGGITNFAANLFTVDSSLFQNDLAGGYFFVRTNFNSLILSFTNNHPPTAATVSLYRAGTTMAIPISSLVPYWSDPDGDPVAFDGVDFSTNVATVATDANFIYYTNANNVADQILYTVEDIRTNPPAVYRPDDTQQTGIGRINLLVPPSFGRITVAGSNVSISGAGGIPGGPYRVLTSSDLTLPLNQWMAVATNGFDADGRFSITNAVNPSGGQAFYLLEVQ